MGKDVIIACDFASAGQVMDFLSLFGDKKPFVKIGMELYYAGGPDIVRRIKDAGHPVFLDLKLHDIPNTVKKTMTVLSRLGVDMTNVHAAGTAAMMEAAMDGLSAGGGQRPLLIAVTQLTSTDEKRMREEILIGRSLEETVVSYAALAARCGLDGVVCSPLEAEKIHSCCGGSFLTVTPGVRLAGDAPGDQARVTTPLAARKLGADFIVVGRSITAADDPAAAYEKCVNEFLGR